MRISKYLIALSLGFFSVNAPAWTIHADFDSGELGTTADRLTDGFSGAGGGSLYSNETVIKGNSAKLHIEEGKTGWGMWGGEFIFPEKVFRGEKLWYQVHVYFPEDFDHYSYGEGNRLKFLRITTRSNENQNQGAVDFLIDMKGSTNPFKWIFEGQNIWSNVGSPEDMIVKGKWESYQIQVTFDTIPLDSGGMAESRIWKNGVLLKHITDKMTLKDETSHTNRALLFTYWNGGSPKSQSMYVDEITITNETPDWKDSHGNPLIKMTPPNNPPSRLESVSVK
jgi:hypothetical protein